MRISGWSSDVCSSDLFGEKFDMVQFKARMQGAHRRQEVESRMRRDTLLAGAQGHGDRAACGEYPNPSGRRSGKGHAGQIAGATGASGAGSDFRFSVSGRLSSMIAAMEKKSSEEHTYELPSLMSISYADFCVKKPK